MAETPFLIAGLGNPGDKYADTRHNVGFWVLDALAQSWNVSGGVSKFEGWFLAAGRRYLLKPQTYMNLSGQSVAAALNFYKLDPTKDLLVIVDDLDLPLGQLRIRKGGSAGGHNGLKSIIECLGTDQFPRLRLGIGREGAAVSHVLGKVSKSEKEILDLAVKEAVAAIQTLLEKGLETAMNQFNRRKEP